MSMSFLSDIHLEVPGRVGNINLGLVANAFGILPLIAAVLLVTAYYQYQYCAIPSRSFSITW